MAFVKVGSLSALPPCSVIEVTLGEDSHAVCNLNGELHALTGICPHAGGPIGQGTLQGQLVVCPWHEWAYVRATHEYQICRIPYAQLIPLGDLPKRVNELDSADEIVAHCKSGMRSAKAVDFLKQAGFKKVRNMKGGILAWSDKVDPSVPKY